MGMPVVKEQLVVNMVYENPFHIFLCLMLALVASDDQVTHDTVS